MALRKLPMSTSTYSNVVLMLLWPSSALTMCRLRSGSFINSVPRVTIQWVFIEGRGKGRPVKRESLRSPPTGQYRMANSRFPKAKTWELEAIAAAEDEFEKIRRCCEHLKTMTRVSQGYESIMRANAPKR